ncbi:hypothetical protein BJ508DRAFT_380903 [Ascobolus immersus RN42]|uniref:Ubiquitin-like domain-containing protein n=1 Tax=Ascobolus immersus RN42 TaxID=1160509 RepID=A0A3N4HIQ3_ASCIM|nr:hypothetical protein BJ508DRAFT_380903 [Ascobolus immersus RN42]
MPALTQAPSDQFKWLASKEYRLKNKTFTVTICARLKVNDHPKVLTFDVPGTGATVSTIKKMFEDITGIEAFYQKLYLQSGKLLSNNDATLLDCGIFAGSTGTYIDMIIEKDIGENTEAEAKFQQRVSQLSATFEQFQNARQQSELPPRQSFKLPKPFMLHDKMVQPLNDLYDLTPSRTGLVSVQARLSLLQLHRRQGGHQSGQAFCRYLMRDGCGYGQLINVPEAVSFEKGIWYTVIGTAEGLCSDGPTGVVSFISAERDSRDIGPAGKNIGKLELLEPEDGICADCGAEYEEYADEDHECDAPVNPRTLQCLDCREVGHTWHSCPYLIPPSGRLPKHPNPEMTPKQWEEYVKPDFSDNIFCKKIPQSAFTFGKGCKRLRKPSKTPKK